MTIEGNVRADLISAISAVRRWRGRPVHRDTVNYWRRVLDQGRQASTYSFGESTAEVVAELERELAAAPQIKLHLP